jgi:hypothetical protein
MREKLEELARMHSNRNASAKQAGQWAKSIGICFPAILAYVRELEGVSIEAKKERDWYNEASEGRRALVRELDVLMNGEKGAARQAALCDIVAHFPAWLAARDARMKRVGAAETWDRVAAKAAKRLREGK